MFLDLVVSKSSSQVVRGRTDVLTVVEDEVDAGQLLESLEGHAGELALDHVSAEAVEVARLPEAHLILVVCSDLSKLGSDGRVVRRETPEEAKGTCGLVPLALLDQKPRGLGQDEHAANEDDGPRELHCDRDTIRSGIVAVGRSIIHDSCQEETDSDCPLVGTHDGTSYPLRCRLGLIEGDQSRDEAHAKSSKEAAGDEKRQGRGGSLQDNTEDEDDGGGDEGQSTPNVVSQEGGREGTEEGACRQDTDDRRLFGGGDVELVGGWVAVAGGEEMLEVGHG